MTVTFSVLTLFPEMITSYCDASILGRAQRNQHISVNVVNPRDFTTDKHHRVDEPPYGGGDGMVMLCEPVVKAYESLLPLPEGTPVLMMSPAGEPFTYRHAKQWAQDYEHMVFLCGHYEGMDARINQLIPNVQPVSVGDFVLTGGELPALCMMDAVSRFVPDVVQKAGSVSADTFENGLLEYPHYTRPAEYRGLKVPDVLLSGNHAAIDAWRLEQSIGITQRVRPDLWEKYQEEKKLNKVDKKKK